MSFRARVLCAMIAAALGPLGLFAVGVRREASSRIEAEEDQRIAGLATAIEHDLAREAASVGRRLDAIAAAAQRDDRLRLAAVGAAAADRRHRIDWAREAMRLSGLDVLQLHDSSGRILSSGQFRNDFDRIEPPPRHVEGDSVALAAFRTPEGPVVALVRSTVIQFGSQRFELVGGAGLDAALLERFAGDDALAGELVVPDDTIRSTSAAPGALPVREIAIPFAALDRSEHRATLRILRVGDAASALRAEIDRWFLVAAALVGAAALALGAWLSAALSRPLARLAEAADGIALVGGGQSELPEAERPDEIGALSRRLTTMARRLHRSAEALRSAERRATVGDMARQVNHDIKNGLVPIRNVLRHLGEVQERSPEALAEIYGERRHTLDASVSYLDALARRYARLAPRPANGTVDVAAVASEVVAAAADGGAPVSLLRIAEGPVLVPGDPVALRRVIENLVRNGIESLTNGTGSVTVCVERSAAGAAISVEDSGCGMSEAELTRAFDDFHSTKPGGSGLGLSVVCRLTSDAGGRLRIESAPGRGTTVHIHLPGSGSSASAQVRGRQHPMLRGASP